MASLPRLVNAWFPNFIDVDGGQANAFWTIQDQSDAGFGPYDGLAEATQNLSVAGLFAAVTQSRTIPGATPTSGVYGTVMDQAIMRVASIATQSNLAIPAPISSIFLSDMLTVDLSNTLVQAWWTEVQALLGDSYGNPWTQLLWGQRRMINLSGS
jgi:hypothetical protein